MEKAHSIIQNLHIDGSKRTKDDNNRAKKFLSNYS